MKTRIIIVGTLLAVLVAFVASGQPGSGNFTAIRLLNAGDGSNVPSVNGSIFYNQSTNKFRAFENGTWKDLIGGGGGGITNGAANNEIMKSDGTNAVASGLFMTGTRLSFPNSYAARKLVLYQSDDNDHEFYGFGVQTSPNRMTYHSASGIHAWYAPSGPSSSDELMRLTGDGRLAIGLASPDYVLDVSSSSGSFIRNTTTGSGHVGIALVRSGGTASGWDVYLPTGSTNLAFWDGSANRFTFSTGGVGTGTDWIATSDRRLKVNIRTAGSQLATVLSIAELVRNYDRVDNRKNETGFIAQELHQVAPEYVNVPEADSAMWAVNYAKMVVPLYKAVAELQEQINELKEENALLRMHALDTAGRRAHRNRYTEAFQEADGEFIRKMKALKTARR